MIAEEFRSILQQEVRNRNRRQDVYDLYYLISKYSTGIESEKIIVLQELKDKSIGKGIDDYININGLDREDIISRSKQGYSDIKEEISGELPDFDIAYNKINEYFKELPWKW